MTIAIIVFITAIILGIPLAFVLGLFGTVHILMMDNPLFLNVLIQRMFSGVNIIAISCIPFFIMTGELMNGGGVTKRLLDLIRQLIGWTKGGMAYSTVVISAVLAAILGSAQGQAALLCQVLVPDLKKDGYSPEFSGALISASSVLGPIIPPSTMFIFYCMLTEVSIKYMFIAGIIPGIILMAAYCITISIKIRRMNIKGGRKRPSFKPVLRTFVKAIPAILVPVVILGGILTGAFTPTESGAVACVAAVIAGLLYREFNIKEFPDMMLRASMTTGAIFVIITFGNIIAWSMAMDGIPDLIIGTILKITSDKNMIILLILAVLIMVGAVLDMASATLIFIPVMFPLSQMIGMDSVHFGIVFSIMITLGLVTPPVGQVLFVTSISSGISFNKIATQIGPFVLASLVVVIGLSYMPDLVLFIPRALGYVSH